MLSALEMVMALTAGLSLAVIARGWMVAFVILSAALLAKSWVIPLRYSTTPAQHRRLLAVLGMPFVAMAGALMLGRQSAMVISEKIAVLGSVYLLLTAVLEVYRKADESRPALFMQAVNMVMLVAGLSLENDYYPYCLALYCGAGVLLLRRPYPGLGPGRKLSTLNWPGFGPLVGFVAALAMAQWLFVDGMPRIGRMIVGNIRLNINASLQPESRIFGSSSDLSTLRRASHSKALAARVVAPGGRLRGQVLVTYESGRWSVPMRADRLREVPPQDGVCQIRPGRGAMWAIYPVKNVSGQMPGPPGAYQVQGTFSKLEVDPADGLWADTVDPYEVWTDEKLVGEPKGCDQIEPALAAQLAPIADRLLGVRRGNPWDEATALEAFLSLNGTYDADAKRHPGVEPVVDFLESGLHGYCEYFATSMAMLLRSRGVNCRYVVGFVLREKNKVGDYWLVRDCDSHAWVEVYDPRQGWRAFDPTPLAHMQSREPDTEDALWDGATMAFWRGWTTLLGLNWTALGSVFGVLGLGWLIFRLKPWSWKGRAGTDPLEVLRLRATARWRKLGWERRPEETWLEFAERAAELPGVAEWVALYCRLRYEGGPPEALEELTRLTASSPAP